MSSTDTREIKINGNASLRQWVLYVLFAVNSALVGIVYQANANTIEKLDTRYSSNLERIHRTELGLAQCVTQSQLDNFRRELVSDVKDLLRAEHALRGGGD